jgi:hypothetical protein
VRRSRAAGAAAAFSLCLHAACAPDPASPEERVAALLARAAAAVQAGDLEALRDLVSDSYSDAAGGDKRAITGLVAAHILRSRSIHLLTRVRSARETEPGRLTATVLVALAGQPIALANDLDTVRADLLQIDLALAEEGGARLRVTGAVWRQASRGDFL